MLKAFLDTKAMREDYQDAAIDLIVMAAIARAAVHDKTGIDVLTILRTIAFGIAWIVGLSALFLAVFLLFSGNLHAASTCLSQTDAEKAVDSYLLSYQARDSALVPSPEGRQQLLDNLMCKGQPALQAAPKPLTDFERNMTLNSTHYMAVVFQGGKNIMNITRAIKAEAAGYETATFDTPAATPSSAPAIETTCSVKYVELVRAFNLLSLRMRALCMQGIGGACEWQSG